MFDNHNYKMVGDIMNKEQNFVREIKSDEYTTIEVNGEDVEIPFKKIHGVLDPDTGLLYITEPNNKEEEK